MSNQIKRPYPDNWPWGAPHKHPEGDTPPPFEGFNVEVPEEGTVMSNLAHSVREAKMALNSVVSVPAVFACDVEDGDIVIPLPCEDTCNVNCDELLKTLRDLQQIPDAIWIPAFRASTDSQVSTLSSVDPTTYDPPFYGVAYTGIKRVMVGPVVVHPRFKFHTGDKIYAGSDGDLTTTANEHMVGVCLAPGAIFLSQYASVLREAMKDLYDEATQDAEDNTIEKIEQEGLQGDNIKVTTDGATTERPLELHLGDIVNVKDFGAKGDGVTNDTNAFNTAIAHMQELGSNVCLFIPPGDYLVTTLPNVPCYGPGSIKYNNYLYSPFELLFKLNGAIQKDTNGRYKVDFTKMSEADLAALIKQLLPTAGGGLTTDDDGKLVVDFTQMFEEELKKMIESLLPDTGGGLTTDEDGKLVVDFTQMSIEELREMIESLLPDTGGGLTTDEDGKLVLDFSQLTPTQKEDLISQIVQEGGGLSVDENGQIYVDFGSMPTDKFEAMLKSIRVPIWLTADKYFYVNGTTGSDILDSGRGESNSKPFATIQACLNYVADNYNMSRYRAIISVADGTYEENLSLPSYNAVTGYIEIRGDTTNREAVVVESISLTYAVTFIINSITVKRTTSFGSFAGIIYATAGIVQLQNTLVDCTGIQDTNTADFSGIWASGSATIRIISSSSMEIPVGLFVKVRDFNKINSIIFTNGGTIIFNADLTIEGNGSSSTITAHASTAGLIAFTNGGTVNPGRLPIATATGTLSGLRYRAILNGVIDVKKSGAEFLPGTLNGTTNTGGQYG